MLRGDGRNAAAASGMEAWTAIFLATTVATSVTGFLLPADHVMAGAHAGHFVAGGADRRRSSPVIVTRWLGWWRLVYVDFGGRVALFQRVCVGGAVVYEDAVLSHLAPTQTEPPFVITQVGGAGAVYRAGRSGHDALQTRGGRWRPDVHWIAPVLGWPVRPVDPGFATSLAPCRPASGPPRRPGRLPWLRPSTAFCPLRRRT